MAKIILRAGKVAIKIILLFAIVGLIFYSVKMLSPARAQTEAAQNEPGHDQFMELCRAAESYWYSDQPEKTKELYEQAFNTWPNYLWADKSEEIDNKLIFAESCAMTGQGQKALEIYQDIFDKQPEGRKAIEAIEGYESLRISLGQDPNVQPILDKFIPRFLDEVESMEALYDIAKSYQAEGADGKANTVYQAMLDNYSNRGEMDAKEFLIKANIGLGNDLNIQKELDGFIAEFADNPGLPEALCVIGEDYGVKAYELKSQGLETEAIECFRKAVTVWERVIHEFPDCEFVPRAYYCCAGCYELELSDYEKAIEYYQEILVNWPYFDYQRASYAQFGIARCYQNLEKSGQISTEEAASEIRQACNNLLANYPDTNPVIIQTARKLLDKYQVSE